MEEFLVAISSAINKLTDEIKKQNDLLEQLIAKKDD